MIIETKDCDHKQLLVYIPRTFKQMNVLGKTSLLAFTPNPSVNCIQNLPKENSVSWILTT